MTMSKFTRICAVMTAAVCFSPLNVASATTTAEGAVFTHPLTAVNAGVVIPGGPSEITSAIVDLLLSTNTASTVDIAMFQFCDTDLPGGVSNPTDEVSRIVNAMNVAANPAPTGLGASVNVLLERNQWDACSGPGDALPQLNANVHKTFCSGGCATAAIKMHNKFLIINSTADKQAVVLQLTSNWTNGQLSGRNWNAGVLMWGDQTLYNGYASYWNDLEASLAVPQHFAGSSDTNIGVDVFPRSSDPVQSQLGALSCGTIAEVDIAMAFWDTNDGEQIADQLRTMLGNGCQIRIVVAADADILKSTAPGSGLTGLNPHCSGDMSPALDTNSVLPTVHSKYMLMRGSFGGVVSTEVFVGSHDFTTEALTQTDDTWVRLGATPTAYPQNAALYAEFSQNFDEIWSNTPPCGTL